MSDRLAPPGRAAIAALAAITAGAAALRFHGLGRESLWLDEALSVSLARSPTLGLLAATGQDGHPPLYLALLHVWIRLFGSSEAAVRSLSATLGVVAVPLIYRLGAKAGSQAAGLGAALLLACSPYHIYYSQETRNYALLVLTALASFHAFLGLARHPGAPGRATYVITTGLMIYTHVYGLLAWGAQLVAALPGIWRAADRAAALRRFVRLQAWVLLLLVPWLLSPWAGLLLRQVDPRTTALQLERPGAVSLLASFYQQAGSGWALPVLTLLAAVGAFRGLRWYATAFAAATRTQEEVDHGPLLATLSCWLLVVHAVPFLVSQVAVPVYINRSTIVALPAFLLLAAATTASFAWPLRAAVLAAVLVPTLLAQRDNVRVVSKEQWRAIAADVDRAARPEDLLVFDAGYGRLGFDHYSKRADVARVALPADAGTTAGTAALLQAAGGRERLWVIRFHRPAPLPPVPGYAIEGSKGYAGLTLYLLVRAGAP